MNSTILISKAGEQVQALFAAHGKENMYYHNLQHTKNVVAAAEKIAVHYQLEQEDYAALIIAAWFHDAGYLFAGYETHEEKSVELAASFLREVNGSDTLRDKVAACIRATKLPQSPGTLIEKIICDADLFHFGTLEFKTINKLVRKEIPSITGKKIGNKAWNRKALSLLEQHQFHTGYCIKRLQKGKAENIAWLKKKLEADNPTAGTVENIKETPPQKPTRGIETMFRTTSSNHLHLSEMADAKANTMITVNSIIASILVSVLFRKIEEDTRLMIPSFMLLITTLMSIVLSILVTRPHIVRGIFSREDVEKKKVNLLFFGNFHKMTYDDYQHGVNAMMEDGEFLYGSMTRDIYNLGRVLGKKYKLLRLAYSFFMIGFTLSIITFVLIMNLAR